MLWDRFILAESSQVFQVGVPMSLPSVSVKHRVAVFMIYILIIGFGIFSFFRLKVDLYPDMDIPYVIAVSTYTGANPADIEELISRPMEEVAVSVEGVKNVTSTSKNSVGMVMMEFDWGYNMDKAESDARKKFDNIIDALPEDATKPVLFAMDPSMQPIILFNVTGDYSISELRKIAEDDIQPWLERIPGISQVDIAGGQLRQIHVKLNPQKLEAYKISPTTIYSMLSAENKQIVGGYIETNGMDMDIESTGKYRNVEEVGLILVGAGVSDKGVQIPIRLKDVAEVEDTFEETRRVMETNGRSTVLMMARKQSGANTVEAARGVLEALPKLEERLDGIHFTIVRDQSEYINNSISNLGQTCITAIVIVFFVLLFFFRNILTASIVAIAIPISIAATLGVMGQMGMTLNAISMSGLALAVGMLVDNSIIVLENIMRLREEGASVLRACIKGAEQIMLAVMASTLTTIAVFAPILFVPGIAGVMFKDISMTVCVALTISIAVALTFVPMTSYFMLTSKRQSEKLLKDNSQNKKSAIRDGYQRMLEGVMHHRLATIIVVLFLFAGAVFGLTKVPKNFMGSSDDSFISVKVETEMGNSVGESYKIIQEALDVIKEIVPENERKMISLDAGTSGSGMSAVFSEGVNAGTIRIPLVKPTERSRSSKQIIEEIREGLKNVPGLTYAVSGRGGPGSGNSGDLSVEIQCDDIQHTRRVTQLIKDRIKDFDDVAEVDLSMDEQKPQVSVEFDREKMSELGLTTSTVGTLLTMYFRGLTATYYSEGGDEYDVVVRLDKSYRTDIRDIERMPIQTNSGATVPLSTIAKISENLAPTSITRKNQVRYQTVNVTLKDDYVDAKGIKHTKDMGASIEKIDQVVKQLHEEDSDGDWNYFMAGTADDFQTSFMYLIIALFLSVILVYMVMASQFESLREPFIVLFTLPLAIIGVTAAFLISGRQLDVTGLIGAIMLVGIVVNNGIVLVDAANQIRLTYPDMSRQKAAVLAGRTRLRPVIMTASTTILSMIPLLIDTGDGAEMWSGMAMTVVGGMTTATIFTLFFVPVLYSLLGAKHIALEDDSNEDLNKGANFNFSEDLLKDPFDEQKNNEENSSNSNNSENGPSEKIEISGVGQEA